MERATKVPAQTWVVRSSGEAILADVMRPQVDGSGPRRRMARRPPPSNVTGNESVHALFRSLGSQEQFLWRGVIEDAPKLMTLSRK